MNRETIIEKVSEKIKLIRTESSYTQDQMAELIGISKKTLVQIEKGRISCGWNVAVTVCTLFRDSMILQNVLGGDPVEVVELTVKDFIENTRRPSDMFWKTLDEKTDYLLQQNSISKYFRISTPEGESVFTTFNEPLIREQYEKIQ